MEWATSFVARTHIDLSTFRVGILSVKTIFRAETATDLTLEVKENIPIESQAFAGCQYLDAVMNPSPPAGVPQPASQDTDKKIHTHNFKLPWKKNKLKVESDTESTGGQEQRSTPGTDPNRSSTTISRRPVAGRNGSNNEAGLEALRQETRDIEEKIRLGQSMAPLLVEGSIDAHMQATSTLSNGAPREGTVYRQTPNGIVNGPGTQTSPEAPSSNPIPFMPTQYPIPTAPTVPSPYTAEPLRFESAYISGGYPRDDFSVQPTANLRAATLPPCEHSPDMCDFYKDKNKALEDETEILKKTLSNAEYELSRKTKLIESMEMHKRTDERILSEKDALINSYRTGMESLQTKHDTISAQAAQLHEDKLALQGQIDKANKEALQMRSEVKRPIETKWFKTKWQDLHDKIELLSNQYFTGRLKPQGSVLTRGRGVPADKTETPLSKKFNRLTHSPSQYLSSETERPLLVQAFIWWVLTNKIFDHMDESGEGLYWAGQTRDHFLELKREMRPKCRKDAPSSDPVEATRLEAENRKYHQWREVTSIMLVANEPVNRRINANGYLITDVVALTTDTLSPYIVRNKDSPRSMAESDIRKQLHIIVTEAIQLDALIYSQRALIFCEQWDSTLEGNPVWGFKFDPNDMEILPGPDQARGGRKRFLDPHVELIVRPALFRRGNYEGTGYSNREVLCPAKVVVGEDPTRPAAQRW